MKTAPIHRNGGRFVPDLTERAGFEPAEPLRVQLFSSCSLAVQAGFSRPFRACASAYLSVSSVQNRPTPPPPIANPFANGVPGSCLGWGGAVTMTLPRPTRGHGPDRRLMEHYTTRPE